MNSNYAPFLVDNLEILRKHVLPLKQQGKLFGLVPTMGALHEGHLSLVRKSLAKTDETIVTIFVNPTQFAPNEDFSKYPRTLMHDLELLSQVGAVTVFAPPVEVMYPNGFDTRIEVGTVTKRLEGESRPGHFSGVATVVLKLFTMTQADIAFFGQKDFQQYCVIKKMIDDLNIPLEIQVCPIVREPDGLAMSSRNRYLSPNEREQALVLSKSLAQALEMVHSGEKDAETIRREMETIIETAPDAKIDYLSIANPNTLEELQKIDTETVILLAVRIGATRLIDNLLL